MDEGRLTRVDPYHLIFMIWAMTQHYADFAVQIRAILGSDKGTGEPLFRTAEATVMRLLADGLRPR
jgi:TetR/AcrR family transcriptional regulator